MISSKQETHEQTLSRIITRCWADAAFKTRLLADPAAVLREAGLDVPAGTELRAVEDTAQRVHWVIPARPAELSDEALENMAGGVPSDGLPFLFHLPPRPGSYNARPSTPQIPFPPLPPFTLR